MNRLTIIALSTFVISACSSAIAHNEHSANKHSQTEGEYFIHVYKDCKKVDKIAMTDEQIDAYQRLQSHEVELKHHERPLQDMEKVLKKYEAELAKMEDQLVIENDDKITINKAAMKRHEEIARKMEAEVAKHASSFENIELSAREIEKMAHDFEKTIKPSIKQYDGDNMHISIRSGDSDKHKHMYCDA